MPINQEKGWSSIAHAWSRDKDDDERTLGSASGGGGGPTLGHGQPVTASRSPCHAGPAASANRTGTERESRGRRQVATTILPQFPPDLKILEGHSPYPAYTIYYNSVI